jgi:spoIIIJ-associated protein
MIDLEQAKKEAVLFFEKLGLQAKLKRAKIEDETIILDFEIEDAENLVGETLFEIQHLLKAILKKKTKENFYLDLDINDYKKKKIKYLQELAKSVADEVALTKQEKILDPMPAYERRIIHLILAERPDVTTESIGKEPNRRVVIKPYP